ncbi:Retrovirus-related Pol polyprotein from transposon opus [Ceratobasidium sp. AG-Ba]|nr:Retrovirus-related Pol polyprotein from transposon opus [Ceratobasidium sp. AG-Ba]
MADGGSHFDCDKVRAWGSSRNVQILKTPPYAPWANGLAEGSIKLLIGRLKALCTPTVGESPEEDGDPNGTPVSWQKHLAQATSQLNDRMLLSLKYTPQVETNMALTYALRQDAYATALEYASRRKKTFDKNICPIEFKPGDLVQRYDTRWDETHSSDRKLVPRWSSPLQVVSRALNSYTLEDLHGQPFASAAHTRLLRPFVPRPNSPLAAYADGLRRARLLNPTATLPISPLPALALPPTPRPESKFLLEREDATQPNKYQIP